METREARIKIVLDASAAKAATTSEAQRPGAASEVPDVPGLPDAAASSAQVPTAAPAPSATTQAAFPPPGASTSAPAAAPGAPPPPYSRSTRVDLQPTAESESGNSASRPGTDAWARNAARGIRGVGTAAIGGGSLTAALAALPGIVPGIGTAISATARGALDAANAAERYGPFLAGAARGVARESGNPVARDFAERAVSALEAGLDAVADVTTNIDAVGAGFEGVTRLATAQGVLSRGRSLSSEQRMAQARSLGVAFEAERRIAAREAQRQRATRRIGLIYAGDQLASLGAREGTAALRAMLEQSLNTAVHR